MGDPDDASRGREAILAYHESTKHSWESVRRGGHLLDWENKPIPFKLYEDVERVELPRESSRLGVPALEAIGDTPGETPPRADLDLNALARILSWGAGIHHVARFPAGEVIAFRNYASAGALYPVEVYVACGDLPGLEAGVYHFEPSGPALDRLRGGDHRAHLVRAAAGEPAVAHAPAILALTGIPWRTAWKYTERGYRHLFWDAGMILANVLPLAASADLPSRVVIGFADEGVAALLGLGDPRREFPLCLVPIGRAEGSVSAAPHPPDPVSFAVRPSSRQELVYRGITLANDAGRLKEDHVAEWRRARAANAGGRDRPRSVRVAAPGLPGDALESVIRRRGSAREFARRPMFGATLATILSLATAPLATDDEPRGSRPIEPYVIANALDGFESGAYVFRDDGLHLLRAGEFRDRAGYLCLEQPLAADAAAVVFLMADLEGMVGGLGPRGYRAAQLEGGIVGGRIYLGAYAHRLGATGLTFYDDDVTGFFSPDAAGKSCMLVVAVGVSPRLEGSDASGTR